MDKWEIEQFLENIIKQGGHTARTKIEAARILSAIRGWIPPVFSVTAVADSNED